MLSGGQGGAVEYDRDGRRRGIGGIGGRRRDDRFAGPEALPVGIEAPETLGYRIKCRLLRAADRAELYDESGGVTLLF